MSQVIKFKNRTSSNTSDKRIADAYSKGGKFDVNLVTADEKVVSAHRFVLSMFSKYLAKKLSEMEFEGKVLSEFSFFKAIIWQSRTIKPFSSYVYFFAKFEFFKD